MDSQKNETTTTEKRLPVQSFGIGLVRVAVWENKTKNGVMHSVTVSRRYLDGATWKSSSSFSGNDLLSLAKLLDEAHSWITAHRATEKAA